MADGLKIGLSFLKEFSKGVIPKASDYEITQNEYGQILKDLQDNKHYVENIGFGCGGGEIRTLHFNGARVTLLGEEYLHENSFLMKAYRGLKEFRDWLP